jgi:hypothetical protein
MLDYFVGAALLLQGYYLPRARACRMAWKARRDLALRFAIKIFFVHFVFLLY